MSSTENYVRNRSDHCLTITQKGEIKNLYFLQKKKDKPDPSGATVISASDNNRLTSIQTTGGNRRLNENNTNNEGNSGLPIQQQEMNDIQVRSVVNNAAANNHGGNNERHEATIEVAIASPEEDMDPGVGTTSALVNNTSSSAENQNQQKSDNNLSDEVPQVKISNL